VIRTVAATAAADATKTRNEIPVLLKKSQTADPAANVPIDIKKVIGGRRPDAVTAASGMDKTSAHVWAVEMDRTSSMRDRLPSP